MIPDQAIIAAAGGAVLFALFAVVRPQGGDCGGDRGACSGRDTCGTTGARDRLDPLDAPDTFDARDVRAARYSTQGDLTP